MTSALTSALNFSHAKPELYLPTEEAPLSFASPSPRTHLTPLSHPVQAALAEARQPRARTTARSRAPPLIGSAPARFLCLLGGLSARAAPHRARGQPLCFDGVLTLPLLLWMLESPTPQPPISPLFWPHIHMNHAGAAHTRASDESVSEASAQRNHSIITALRTAGKLEKAFALAQALPSPQL